MTPPAGAEPAGRAEVLRRDDQRYVWHPFTPMSEWCAEPPLVIAAGDGNHLVDVDGNRYLDAVSSLWANVHGHRHPRLDAALAEQAGRIAHSTMLGLANVPATELARRLVAIAPERLVKVFYAGDGASAVEIALKMAFQYQALTGREGRDLFLRLGEAYHGDTIGSVSVGGIGIFHRIFGPLLFDTVEAPSPYCYRCPLGLARPECAMACADELERLAAQNADRIAAVIVEPLVQAAAGMITAPDGYLRRVRETCDRHGLLMIVDEVATGFGRTGRMFACTAEGVQPDLMTVGKGITGGYLPLSAVLTTQEVFDAFLGRPEEHRTFFHGHTYTGNPLAAAVAVANLDVFEEERTVERLAPRIELLAALLRQRVAPLRHVGDVRQKGLMVGIELVRDRDTKEPFDGGLRVGDRVQRLARGHGVIMRPLGDVVVLMPPLSITQDELDRLVAVTARCIDEATEAVR
ncbi:MAG: adenosylmethionine--8-amino-7-oxononanoate transaminase [Actinomycetota bacterium]